MAEDMGRESIETELEDVLNDTVITQEDVKETYQEQTALNDGQISDLADVAVNFLRSVLVCFDEHDAEINQYLGEEDELIIEINNVNPAVLIGRHGSTLDALQKLLAARVRRYLGFHFPVIIDIEGYRERRKNAVTDMAQRLAQKAITTGRKVRLNPMNSYERRIVHMTLADNEGVRTASEGQGDMRYVVIYPAPRGEEDYPAPQGGEESGSDYELS